MLLSVTNEKPLQAITGRLMSTLTGYSLFGFLVNKKKTSSTLLYRFTEGIQRPKTFWDT